ncbi:MAG: pancreas/duodenum homeobox protein 1 [Desulfobacteraceae bacterium 4572_19]|nr:MAG: pancreas/duodenum homeobox protein 1 [Desulfobacteraceae bacterium 4572_19]
MTTNNLDKIFTKNNLKTLFPDNRADNFFEALYGDASEGAYDISLEFQSEEADKLNLEFHLKQRPQKCLACNLTYGLPHVFEKHPVIGIKALIKNINVQFQDKFNIPIQCTGYNIGTTKEISRELHIIPLTIYISRS